MQKLWYKDDLENLNNGSLFNDSKFCGELKNKIHKDIENNIDDEEKIKLNNVYGN